MQVDEIKAARLWNEFVARQEDSTLFHRYEWASALAEGAGHRPIFLAALNQNEIAGILPLCLMETRLFGRFLVSLPHHMGGLCAAGDEAGAALMEHADELLGDLPADFLEIRSNMPIAQAEKHGLSVDCHKASFFIDLSGGEEALWNNLRKQNRNRIRKGRRAGLQVAAGNNLLDDFWEIFSCNARAIGSVTFSHKFFGAILRAFGADAQILAAQADGRIIAAKLLLRHKDTLTMLWGGTLPDQKTQGANYFLTWETIRHALAAGCRTLDMGRSTVGSGPYEFKARWGGTELRHYFYTTQKTAEAQGLRAENPRFRFARGVWRHLPLPLTRALGPWIARQIP